MSQEELGPGSDPEEVGSWNEEAVAVAEDISSCVKSACVSHQLTSNSHSTQEAFINIETLESRRVTVKVCPIGFTIVGEGFDSTSIENSQPTFETQYALLQNISPSYVRRFGEELIRKLNALEDQPKEGEGSVE